MDEHELRTEMAKAMFELLGDGYVTEYYYDMAQDFIEIAKAYKGDK